MWEPNWSGLYGLDVRVVHRAKWVIFSTFDLEVLLFNTGPKLVLQKVSAKTNRHEIDQ